MSFTLSDFFSVDLTSQSMCYYWKQFLTAVLHAGRMTLPSRPSTVGDPFPSVSLDEASENLIIWTITSLVTKGWQLQKIFRQTPNIQTNEHSDSNTIPHPQLCYEWRNGHMLLPGPICCRHIQTVENFCTQLLLRNSLLCLCKWKSLLKDLDMTDTSLSWAKH